MDADDLFTQYTVAEVKSVQKQLRRVMLVLLDRRDVQPSTKFRADADAKQEELRLMVGYAELYLYHRLFRLLQ